MHPPLSIVCGLSEDWHSVFRFTMILPVYYYYLQYLRYLLIIIYTIFSYTVSDEFMGLARNFVHVFLYHLMENPE